jgi:hypothetical protein
MTDHRSPFQAPRIGVLRCALSGGITLATLFLLCWLGLQIAQLQSHMFIALFTARPIDSMAALFEGLCWAAVFGAVSGLLFAVAYDSLGFLKRR